MPRDQLFNLIAYFVYGVWTSTLVGGGISVAFQLLRLKERHARAHASHRGVCAMASISMVTWLFFTWIFVVVGISNTESMTRLLGVGWRDSWDRLWLSLALVNAVMLPLSIGCFFLAPAPSSHWHARLGCFMVVAGIGLSLFVTTVTLSGG